MITTDNIKNLIQFHNEKKSLATLTAIQPPEKFGVLELKNEYVKEFHEKHAGESSWINGGFFVLEPEIFDYLEQSHNETLFLYHVQLNFSLKNHFQEVH